MATVTLVKNRDQKVSCKAPKIGSGIQEILFFPAIDPELGANENSDKIVQEVWVFEGKRLEKFLAETKKYDEAAQILADAKLKLADATSEAEITAAQEEVTQAQDQMRATLAQGYGKKKDDSVMPIPQGSSKKLIECIGFVNKRTFYISTHDLKKVRDTKEGGKRKFRFDTSAEGETKKMYEIFQEVATDSSTGKTDDKLKAAKAKDKKKEEKNKEEKKGTKKEYVNPKWKKKFFKNIRSKIAKEWKFAEHKGEGQLKVSKINRLVKNKLVNDFLLTDDTCELIDSAVTYFNDTAHFSYQQKEQKLAEIKGLLSKSDKDFDHYDWGRVLLGVQQIWNATNPKFVEMINELYEEFPNNEEKRQAVIKTLYEHKLPKICFDVSGGAQLMRYSANCGGVLKFDLNQAKLAYKADAKFSLLDAGVEGNYYWPSNLGKELKFNAPILEECFQAKKLAEAGKGKNNEDPTFAHNSSFILPSAIRDIAEQLSGLALTKKNSENNELLIQVAGHTDTSGSKAYNTRMAYLRATATHSLFTDDKAQWAEFFERGIWGDHERDMIALNMYMMQEHPQAFKNRLEKLQIGDAETLPQILFKELKAATDNYGYPIAAIKTQSIRDTMRELENGTQSIDGQSIKHFETTIDIPEDRKLIEVYFQQMRAYALQQVRGIDASSFELFYIDTELHPLLAHGEENLKIQSGDEEKIAANRRVSLIPWGVEKKLQPNDTEVNLGRGRVHVHGQVTAAVGATISMAANFELNTYNGTAQLLAKKKEKDKVAAYNGKEIHPTKLGKQNATAKANAEAFVGAKAEASISGALEWDNPEKTDKQFGVLASIGGGLSGTAGAGIEGEFKIGFDQKTGTFQIKMKAVATWGLGGGGAWSFSVGVQQLFDFIKLVYHKLEENHFNFVDIFEDKQNAEGEQTESEINVYELYTTWVGALWEQKEYIKAGVTAIAGVNLLAAFKVLTKVSELIRLRKEIEMNEDNARNLVDNIHADPSVLHFVPPEAKARMLYKIITFKDQSWAEFFSFDNFKRAEDAALHIIRGISHWREWQETMEHLATFKDGSYKPYDSDTDTRGRINRMNINVIYLRNGLLGETRKWNIVRTHIQGLEGQDKAWNMDAMLWNQETTER